MKKDEPFELPDQLKPDFKKAKRLEWITLVYLGSVIIVMYLVMGSSQAMKTAWLEDALSTMPAISFLIAAHFFNRPPGRDFPYGYHRVFSIAFLSGSVALFSMGIFLAVDSTISLVNLERPTIGSMIIFGHQVWMGWVMLIALVYSALPAMILGRQKLPLAKNIHNKILFTDATTQKADYMTAIAAMAGILGVGLGFWWADATAALFISFSVLNDGFHNLKNATLDLMDRYPVHVDNDKKDELVKKVEEVVKSWSWVSDATVRFREEGQVYFGEIIVIAESDSQLSENIEEGLKILYSYHWKIHDIVISPVLRLPE